MGKSLRVKVADEFSKEVIKSLEKDPRVAGAALSLAVKLDGIEGVREVDNEKDWPKVMELIEARIAKWAKKLPEEKFNLIQESILESLSDEDIEKLKQDFGEEA